MDHRIDLSMNVNVDVNVSPNLNVVELLGDLAARDITLWLEDGQLRFRAPRTGMPPEVIAQLRQHKATIVAWLAERDAFAAGRHDSPLSQGQLGLWLDWQINPTSSRYHLVSIDRLPAGTCLDTLRQAARALLQRHPILRTAYPLSERSDTPGAPDAVQPVQRLLVEAEPDFAVVDGRGWHAAQVETWRREFADRPFDLARGPVMRMAVLEVTTPSGAVEAQLHWSVHHIATDYTSQEILRHDLAALHSERVTGHGPVTAAASDPGHLNHHDFVRWERDTLAVQGDALAAYWRDALSGEPPLLDLPTVGHADGEARRHFVTLDAGLADGLRALARAKRSTLYAVLLAAWQVLLGRHGGQQQFLIASPATTRALPGWTDTVGYFANPVLLRADLGGAPTFATLLQRTQAAQQQALAHQAWPHAEMMRLLQAHTTPQRLHTGIAAFVCVALRQADAVTDDALLQPMASEQRGMPQALTLTFLDRGGVLTAMFTYNAGRFEGAQIAAMAGHLQVLLQGIVANPEAYIHALPLLTEAEQRQLLAWNATERDNPQGWTLVDLFEAHATVTPAAPAVVFGDTSLCYADLDARANRIAQALIARGVGPDTLVGLCVSRSPDMVAGLLGILKAGGAYVPLDPDYPPERLRFMLEDCGASLVLTQQGLTERVAALAPAGCVLLGLDEPDAWSAYPADQPTRRAGPDDLAYVIYTSGSTGQPKGACLPHRALTNMVTAFHRVAPLAPGFRGLTLAPFGFDVAVWEAHGTLGFGGALHIVSRDLLLAPEQLARYIRTYGIDSAYVPPALLEPLLDALGGDVPLRRLLVGVESIRQGLLQAWQDVAGPQGLVIVNGYGPTETAICSTFHRFTAAVDAQAPTPIGRPIDNTRIHLLDAHLQRVPPGVPGELCIAGTGLARGYLNRPDLTAEKFIEADLGGQRERLYRTGDLARWRPDGQLDYLGRIDHQIKLRGFRIEPGEVEAALVAHPAVIAAAAVVHGQGADAVLVGHVGLKDIADTTRAATLGTALRRWLQQRLPAHLVPTHLVVHARLPLTPNGKIDRRALPPPNIDTTDDTTGNGQVAPRTPVEATLAAVFAEVLGRQAVGVHDDFFELGGHSLLALRLVRLAQQRLERAVTATQLYRLRSVAALAAALDEAGVDDTPDPMAFAAPLPVVTEDPIRYPLSHGQRALWFLQQSAPLSHAWNSGLVLRLRGPLQRSALQQTLTDLVARHAALRLVVRVEDGEPMQQVLPPTRVVPAEINAAGLDAGALAAQVRAQFTQPFDLTQGVFRPVLIHHADDDHLLVLSIHHLATDAGSGEILARELAQGYGARCAGTVAALPPLRHGWADFARWEQALLETAGPRLRTWWHQQLAGELPVLQLPLDVPRPPSRTFNGRAHVWHLDANLTQRVKAVARRRRVSLFTLLLAVYLVQLHRTTGQSDLLVGTAPEAGRARAEFAPVVGYFVNLVALRSRHDPDASPDFADFLDQVAQTVAGALEHQHYPFPALVQELLPQRDPSVPPLVQTLFLLGQQDESAPLTAAGLQMTPWALAETGGQGAGQFDLALLADEHGGCLRLVFDHNADLFHADTIARMAGHYTTLLEAVVATADADARGVPDTAISRLPMLTAAEQQQLQAWNATDAPRSATTCVHQLFEAQAEHRPQAIALVCGGEQVSYRELDVRADRLAKHLRRAGVGRGALVALWVDSGPALVTGMLGTLKAGGAFLPLDPHYPRERLIGILEDAGVQVLLTQAATWPAATAALKGIGATVQTLDLDTLCERPAAGDVDAAAVAPDDLAYVIYTSGSTGQPKGVLLPHRGLVNLAEDFIALARLTPESRFAQFAAWGFDGSVFEVLVTLAAGATLVLATPQTRADPLAKVALLQREQVSVATLPPSLLATLDPDAFPHLTTVVAVGEACPWALALRWSQGRRFLNGYGPTEATVGTSFFQVTQPVDGPQTVPIGRPVANTRLHLLDTAGQVVPVGVPGELCIGGVGLAHGYLNRPDLTTDKFVERTVMGRRERLYRTGDLARRLGDGNLEFLGRIDHQVKLRGFRVELGEIEAVLRTHPALADAAVIVREDRPGEPRLVAYTVTAAGVEAADSGALRAFAAERLPAFMLPAAWVGLDALPRNPSGKVDRRALPVPTAVPRSDSPMAPQTALERRLAALWQELLQVEQVGRDDSFFELGGHSLLLVKLKNRLDDWGVPALGLVDLFRHPTVATLARHLASVGSWDGHGGEPLPAHAPPPDDTHRAEARRTARGAGLRQRQLRKDARTEETSLD